MMKLESERPNIQADLEAGKRLQKEKNAPVFVAQQVSELDKKWKDTNEKAKAKHEKLKVKQSLLHLDCKAQQSVHASMTYKICAKCVPVIQKLTILAVNLVMKFDQIF